MYAIIETGGKQYQVKEGDEIFIEKLGVEADDTVRFDKIIAVGKDDSIDVGAPYVSGAEVEATVVKNGKGKKINIFTYKRKKGSSYKRKGHRQPYTKVRIDAIRDSAPQKPKAESKKQDGGLKNYTSERIVKAQEAEQQGEA